MKYIISVLRFISSLCLRISARMEQLMEHRRLRQEWQKFYKDQFGLDVDFRDVVIPQKPAFGLWFLIIVAKGITNEQIFARMQELFNCTKCSGNLDTNITVNKRTAQNGSYAIWVRNRKEPDAEWLELSTRVIDSDMEVGVTLTERLLHGLKYFLETEKHLDTIGITLCSGSRYDDGYVPGVYWSSGGEVYVYWFCASESYARSGIRQIVSH